MNLDGYLGIGCSSSREKWVVATGYENLLWSPGCPREEGNKMNAMDAQQQHIQPL